MRVSCRGCGRLKANEPTTRRDRDCMRPIAGPQVFHDVLDMNPGRLFRDEEAFGDIAISVSFAYVAQNVDLAIRERFVAEMLDKMEAISGETHFFPAWT